LRKGVGSVLFILNEAEWGLTPSVVEIVLVLSTKEIDLTARGNHGMLLGVT